jgi:hypothetical protein
MCLARQVEILVDKGSSFPRFENGEESTGNIEALFEAKGNPELFPSEIPDGSLSIVASNSLVKSFKLMLFDLKCLFFLHKLCNTQRCSIA